MSFAPYDDRDDPRFSRPPFPMVVLIAGIIWICTGIIALINVLLTLGMQGAAGAGNVGSLVCPTLVGIAFLSCGLQTVKGTANDTRGNSIGSLVFGSLQGLVAIVLISGTIAMPAAPGQANMAPEEAIVAGIIVGGMGSMLILAGILGLAGRDAYRQWRRSA